MKNAAALAVALALSAPVAEAKVYSGSEVQALRCAAYFSNVGGVGERAGLLQTEQADVLFAMADEIIYRYVSGTDDEISAALKQIWAQSYGNGATFVLVEAMAYVDWCRGAFLPDVR